MSLRCLIVDDSDEFLASAARLLVDVELGDEDGIELAEALEDRVPSMRAILISAHDREELGLLTNGVEFLPKSRLGAAAIEKLI